MDTAQIASLLDRHRSELKEFGVRRLSVFGSVARGESTEHSDIDFLVEFDGPATFDRYTGLLLFLEEAFGGRVDLATPKMIRSELRARVEQELVPVA